MQAGSGFENGEVPDRTEIRYRYLSPFLWKVEYVTLEFLTER